MKDSPIMVNQKLKGEKHIFTTANINACAMASTVEK